MFPSNQKKIPFQAKFPFPFVGFKPYNEFIFRF